MTSASWQPRPTIRRWPSPCGARANPRAAPDHAGAGSERRAFRPGPAAGAPGQRRDGPGQVNVRYDPDGMLRRVHLRDGGGAGAWTDHLALKAFRLARPKAARPPDELIVPFAGPPGAFPTVSFATAGPGRRGPGAGVCGPHRPGGGDRRRHGLLVPRPR